MLVEFQDNILFSYMVSLINLGCEGVTPLFVFIRKPRNNKFDGF